MPSLSWARNRSAGSPSTGILFRARTTSVLSPGVDGVRAQAIQIAGQPSHARADRHLVVVEDHQDLLVHRAGVVHGLEHNARGERAVANHGHRMAIGRSAQGVAHVQPQQRGDARPGMSRHEQIVRALRRIGVTHEAPFGADRAELVIPPGHQLVRIDLMPRVPDQPIVAEIEHAVQGQAQFHHAEIRGEVGRPGAQQVAQHVADFVGQLLQLRQRHVAQRCGRLDAR